MFRSACSALLSLVCVSSVTALAQAPGAGAVSVTLTPSANPTASGVSVTSTVQAVAATGMTAVPHPSGTVTIYDGTTLLNAGGASLSADPSLSSLPFEQVFGAPYDSFGPNGAVTGDFDGDGKTDLIVYGGGLDSLTVQAFLSSNANAGSQGNYRVLPPQIVGLSKYAPPAVLDVNGDGKLDLLVGTMVAYGNGDGTFGEPLTVLALGNELLQVYAVDVNGDGRLDIVGVNPPPAASGATSPIVLSFTVFRNDGGGTFTSLGTFPMAAPIPPGSADRLDLFGLSFADLNGDGKLDVISQSNALPPSQRGEPPNLYTMLNNGDGTFAGPTLVDTKTTATTYAFGTAFADMNGDGKQDMVLAYSPDTGGNYLAIYPGQGDGTFGAPNALLLDMPRSSPASLQSVAVLDINGDGLPDAVTGAGSAALGDGKGGLVLSSPLFPEMPAVPAYSLLLATLHGESPSLIFLNRPANTNAVFTPVDTSSVTTNLTLSAGMHSLTAHYSGDANYAAAVSPAVPLQIAQATTTLTLASSQNPSYVGGTPLITATVTGLLPNAGGTVTFTSGSTTLTMLPLKNGSASFNLDLPATPGDFPITANYSGDANNAPASGNLTEAAEAPISIPTPPPGTTTLTVTSGSAVQGSITVSGSTGYTGPLGLSCTGLPANASCSFTPQIPSIGSGPTTFTFYVATNSSAPILGQVGEPSGSTGLQIVWCGVPLIGALLIGSLRRYRAVLLCLMVSVIVLIGINGCGGNSSQPPMSSTNTPLGSYTFQVNASSSGVSASQTFTLIVQ